MHQTFQASIERAKKTLEDAEYVLLGGGAGLSAAAGITHIAGKDLQPSGIWSMI
ncbi:hypothetical protein I6J18_18270 [Peribacillus psychrosaccharolyticus]|uniref:Uncharacterized protein n=1 Tax=Peribacillus psychrosaccharolyticus TaxID=1407 RepID=A0A974NKM0_PERPY|nr:hypothetical protein [Peribacillus psychrosaccharolyticus]MEC2054751.1 hypothetical protein [Peribacillus psychrosaccharolyticus]MED3744022.1 hypothetical protein [Peribacillus psychrosaccharolyticus]QQS99522.1 hypothetical protein I6J18_18270 [Peribacillus psychrosaccharolyticus]